MGDSCCTSPEMDLGKADPFPEVTRLGSDHAITRLVSWVLSIAFGQQLSLFIHYTRSRSRC